MAVSKFGKYWIGDCIFIDGQTHSPFAVAAVAVVALHGTSEHERVRLCRTETHREKWFE